MPFNHSLNNLRKRHVHKATIFILHIFRLFQSHRATLDPHNIRDYLDDCIIEFEKDPGFTDRMLSDTTISFMPDASETLGK